MVKVLFIDDETRTHETLKAVLPDPYVLLSAYTARQGIEAAEREGPDVVLLDINLPDLDGIVQTAPPKTLVSAKRCWIVTFRLQVL